MINNVVLTGRLTKDVDLKYTGNGTAVASFTLAVDRAFKNQNGEREADFIMCQAWKKTAELIANSLRKGSLVGIVGRIQTRNYENQQGQRVYVTEVIVENMTFLESRSNQNNGNYQGNNNYQPNNQSNSNNRQQAQTNSFNDYNSNQDPFLTSGQSIDISDDDLPF